MLSVINCVILFLPLTSAVPSNRIQKINLLNSFSIWVSILVTRCFFIFSKSHILRHVLYFQTQCILWFRCILKTARANKLGAICFWHLNPIMGHLYWYINERFLCMINGFSVHVATENVDGFYHVYWIIIMIME